MGYMFIHWILISSDLQDKSFLWPLTEVNIKWYKYFNGDKCCFALIHVNIFFPMECNYEIDD